MKLILENIFIIAIVATPILILEVLKSRSAWIGKNHDWLSVLTWIVVLFAVYIWVLPNLGLEPNPQIFN